MKAWIGLLAEKAACREADPGLFDVVDGPLVHMALSYCQRCEVTQECDTFVRPRRSLYDGVVAGRLWRNGRVIDAAQDSLWDAVD